MPQSLIKFLLAVLVSAGFLAVAWLGYIHAPWWQPVLVGVTVWAGRELITSGLMIRMTKLIGPKFLIPSLVMPGIAFAGFWAIGYWRVF